MDTKEPLINGVAWQGKNLLITDPAVGERLRRKRFSFSSSKSMKGCIASWAGDKLIKQADNPFLPTDLGTDVHAILEHMFKLPADYRTQGTFMGLALTHGQRRWHGGERSDHMLKLAPQQLYDGYQTWLAEIMRLGFKQFEIEDPREVDVYATEMKFDMKIDGIPSIGFIDRVDRIRYRGKVRLKPLDYKSGNMPNAYKLRMYGDDHGDQTRYYAKVLELMTGERPAQAEVHYTQFGKKRVISLAPDKIAKTMADYSSAWEIHNRVMEAQSITLKPSALCGWCPLVNSCPVARKEGFEARKEGLPSAVQLGIPTVRKSGTKRDRLSAHIPGDSTPETEKPMKITLPEEILLAEGKPLDELVETTVNKKRVVLTNANGFAYRTVTKVTDLAYRDLKFAGITPTRNNVDALARTYGQIIAKVANSLTKSKDWSAGIRTAAYYEFRSALITLPAPLNAAPHDELESPNPPPTLADWREWSQRVATLTHFLLVTSLGVQSITGNEDDDDEPFEALIQEPESTTKTSKRKSK